MELSSKSLTSVELQGLNSDANIADGHAHQSPNPSQKEIIAELSTVYAEAKVARQAGLERALLQQLIPSDVGELPRPVLLYSASLAIHVVARVLADAQKRCVLVSPTFDNLPDLVAAQGVALTPVSEDDVLSRALDPSEALFAVLPNNPTGFDLDAGEFEFLARRMAADDRLLICDFSFRYFQEQPVDHYAILQKAGTPFIAIEDTGKYLPALDLKVGVLVSSHGYSARIRRICEDILLNVSPFTVLLLKRLLERDDPEVTYTILRRNRKMLIDAVVPFGIVPRGRSEILSVEWLKLPQQIDSQRLTAGLAALGVPVLPGGPFHWDDPSRGGQFIRVALLRDPEEFGKSLDALVRGIGALLTEGDV